jgi:glutamate dehydrogenase
MMPTRMLPSHVLCDFATVASLYHRFTPDEDLSELSVSDVNAAVHSHLNLALVRKPDDILVRVFTPQSATDGWQSRHSVLQVVMRDMPFIVDSLTNLLSTKFRGAHRIVHPIMHVSRNAQGELVNVASDASDSTSAESWCEFEVNRLLTPESHDELRNEVLSVLADVTAVNSDWQLMREQATALAKSWQDSADAELKESSAFLEWLADNHLTFLGYRYYEVDAGARRLVAKPETGLGLFRGRPESQVSLDDLPRGDGDLKRGSAPLILTKSSTHATVHRSVYMDYIGVKSLNAKGDVVGEHRFLGLLSREAYSDSVLDIPVVRRTAQRVLDSAGYVAGSHSYKNVLQFLETFPRDEMLHADPVWLEITAEQVLKNESRRKAQAFLSADPWGRFISVVVYLPRDIYNTQVRRRIEKVLTDAFESPEVETSAQLSESALARLNCRVRVGLRDSANPALWAEVQRQISNATHSWRDDFVELVIARSVSDESANKILGTWQDAFNDEYVAAYRVDEAIEDVFLLQHSESRAVRVVPAIQDGTSHYVRIFNAPEALRLSALLPVFTAFGLDVADEYPYALTPQSRSRIWLHDIGFNTSLVLDAQWVQRFEPALLAALAGECEVDSLLQLVISARLTHEEVAILRTVVGYVAQWGTMSANSLQEALTANPHIAHDLYALFNARLNPSALTEDNSRLIHDIESALDAVTSLDADTALRALLATICAVTRTNAYQEHESPYAIAIKIAPNDIPQAPQPKPFAEIWMESPRIRGVHLRFGRVARGGLRWSDRRDDMRTEVLGLVRAQVVKNAVIVPTGSKGGFFAKQLPDSSQRDAWLAAGVAAYKEFINGLLDVTDNRVGSAITHPDKTVCRDGDDSYLVVAADKGTATFSDIANSIALERGYWLGDAFASGGSNGYDHKVMGITARGAWESVKHHAARMGLDPNVDALTVVGVGDMSGDVFGNGMLLSKSIRLIAAFDHRNIFIDPNPDAAKTWVERKRLFDLPRSSWADFDAKVMSKGGGIYSRSDKRIVLSAEAQAALGISVAELTPNELVSAILKAPVDLLWNGGIGTYVKSVTETHAMAGDKSNDAVRIDADELRCRIVGEGGNLGFTQKARIDASLNGVRINTDAIDNSAGVDTSDHEVNLKILLSLRDESGLPQDERNQLLKSLTDEVAELVLEDNRIQNQVLTIAESQAASMANVHERVIAQWESEGKLNRKLETLPSTSAFAERVRDGRGLVRPELSVLLAHAKIALTEELLHGTAIDESWTQRYLLSYFPVNLQNDFVSEISQHPLRREIIATVLANRMINHGGITMVMRAVQETGGSVDAVTKAFVIAEQCGDISTLLHNIEALGLRNIENQATLSKEIRRYFDRVIRWLVSTHGDALDVTRDGARYAEAASSVRNRITQDLVGHERTRWQQQSKAYQDAGVAQELADTTASLLDSFASFDLAEMAANSPLGINQWSHAYFTISDELGGDMLLSTISALPRNDRWQTMARAALRSDMYSVLAVVTRSVLTASSSDDLELKMQTWREQQAAGIARVRVLLDEIASRETPDIAAISVALRTLRELSHQTESAANHSN